MNKYTAFNHVSQCRDSVSQEQVAATAAEWAARAETVKVAVKGDNVTVHTQYNREIGDHTIAIRLDGYLVKEFHVGTRERAISTATGYCEAHGLRIATIDGKATIPALPAKVYASHTETTALHQATVAAAVCNTQAGSRCVAGRIATINQWCSIPSAPGWWSQSYCHLIADTTYELSLETDKVWSPATLAEADIAGCDELTPNQCDALDVAFEALVAASDAYQNESIA